jgi:D-3-phosphoglycerate dehydrogenase
MTLQQTVLLTDRAWPDDSIERGIIEDAGFRLVAGPADPAPVEGINALIAEHQPAAILTCWATVSAEAIASSAPLRVVARMGVGLDNIAVPAATDHGVQVTNVPDYCVEEVSDHAVGLALAWTRGLVAADREVRARAMEPRRGPASPPVQPHLRRCRIWPHRASHCGQAEGARSPRGDQRSAPAGRHRRN